jgi:hypothetical protein
MDKRNIIIIIIVLLIILLKLIDKEEFLDNSLNDIVQASSAIGPPGVIGKPGLIGKTGPKGFDGSKGDSGDRGITGQNGARGFMGNNGPKGWSGITPNCRAGSNGKVGIRGYIGDRGVVGDRGKRGNTGDRGQSGTRNPTAANVDTKVCIDGVCLESGIATTLMNTLGKVVLIGNTPKEIKKDELIDRINITRNYRLSFEIYFSGKVGGWSQILKFSTHRDHRNHYYHYGQVARAPSIYVHSNTTKLHPTIGTQTNGNWKGCDNKIEVGLYVWKTVKIEVIGRKVKMFLNNVLLCNDVLPNYAIDSKNVGVYCCDHTENPAKAEIKNLIYERLHYTKSDLKIISAKYGLGGSWLDVKTHLTSWIDQNGHLTIDRSLHLNNTFGDPVPGPSKFLIVKYQVGGKTSEWQSLEHHNVLDRALNLP